MDLKLKNMYLIITDYQIKYRLHQKWAWNAIKKATKKVSSFLTFYVKSCMLIYKIKCAFPICSFNFSST